jgi:hypothetical protein
MLYKPSRSFAMWDVWLVHRDGVYYLYHLVMHATPRQGWHGAGVGLATSADGVRWTERGIVLPRDDGATGMGTGMVWRAADFDRTGRYIMNYSTWFDWAIQSQSIRFAESTDLVHWTKLGELSDFAAEPRWYKTWPSEQDARWDCIYPVPRPGGGLYGYWTATPKEGVGFGFGETLDGVTWTALEPPAVEGTGQGEVGAVEPIGGRYYLLYHGGRDTLVSDRPDGPFRPAAKNRELLAGHCYFTRFALAPDGLVVCHQSMRHNSGIGEGNVHMAPLKRARLDDEGTLRLAWWPGNDVLKGTPIPVAPGPGGPVKMLDRMIDPFAGALFETTVRLAADLASRPKPNTPEAGPLAASSPETGRIEGAGFYVEYEPGRGTYLVAGQGGVIEIGIAGDDATHFLTQCRIDRELPASRVGHTARLRLLLRDSMMELYLDDVLMQVTSAPARATGRVGLFGPAADVEGWVFPD